MHRYGVSTIRRWETKGTPLDDTKAILILRANEKSRTRSAKAPTTARAPRKFVHNLMRRLVSQSS